MRNKQSATTELPVDVDELEALTVRGSERLHGADGRHYVVLGEVIDLYVMASWVGLKRYRVFAYQDLECFFVGNPQRDHEAACGEFMQSHYGDRLWLFEG